MIYYSRLHTSPILVRMQIGRWYEKEQDILVSRNWTMSKAEQQVAEVQSQQRSRYYIVRENRIVSQRPLVHARFGERARDYGARVCPSGLPVNDHLRSCQSCQASLNY